MSNFINPEQISRMVVALQDATTDVAGTGILVTSSEEPFILTAEHIAKYITFNGQVVMKGPGDKTLIVPITQLSREAPIFHPVADVAAFKIFPLDSGPREYLLDRFLRIEYFSNEIAAPSRDITLTSFGFPLCLGTNGYFSPFTFKSTASSGLVTMRRADAQKDQAFFAMENPSPQGYSGGPVADLSFVKTGSITTTGGGTRFYGITHGTISDKTGGKLAMISPSFYVHELLHP